MTRQDRSDHGLGFDARKTHFVAKTQEFLERLRSCEFPGRAEYESQIERDLQELGCSQTKQESERIVNGICLKVAIACYALKAHDRASGHENPDDSDG